MPRRKPENPQETEALARAQKGIEADADGNHAEAAKCWKTALDYADLHLPGADIHFWIRSGYGAALYEIGAYEESIAISKLALDWCAARKSPLPALTLARSYRRLGNHAAAQAHLDHARSLAGDALLEAWERD